MRLTFEEIKVRREVTLFCPGCNKKRRRTVSAMNTVNPFNKGDDGIPLNRSEVYRKVSKLADEAAWKAKYEGLECGVCGSLMRGDR